MNMIATKCVFTAELLIRRLRTVTRLTPAELDLLSSIRQKPRIHAPGSQISGEDEDTLHPKLIVSGWACRPRVLADGRCQMLSVLLPADIIGDGSERRPLAMAPTVALTAVRTITVGRIFDAIRQEPARYSGMAAALGQFNRLEESRLLDHVVRLGRQSALQRVSHHLLEFYHRSDAIGAVQLGRFPMPLTQEVMGDALGLSLVHVNRTMTHLRRAGLVERDPGTVRIADVNKLSSLADFLIPSRPARYEAIAV